MWTGHVSRVNYLQTSCYPMRIWSAVWTCENILCHHAILQYEGKRKVVMRWDEWLNPLSWQEIIEAHVFLLTSPMKNSQILDKELDDEMLIISKHSDPMWQVVHHRVTYRAVIPKIGHILSPSDHANQMAGEKPQPQFDNLKSKIGFTRPCSGLRIQTYWSNRVNNWRGQLNGENMSWIKQLALERAYLQLNGIYMQLNAGSRSKLHILLKLSLTATPAQPHPAPYHPPWSISKAEIMHWCRAKYTEGKWAWHIKSPCRQRPVLPLTMFDLTALQHVTFSASKHMQLWTKEAMNYDTTASKIMKRGELLGQTTYW